jgi:hypothetical protein
MDMPSLMVAAMTTMYKLRPNILSAQNTRQFQFSKSQLDYQHALFSRIHSTKAEKPEFDSKWMCADFMG